VNPISINEELRAKFQWHRLESTNGSVGDVLKLRVLQQGKSCVCF
jgi:hypothetical protein